MEINRRDFLVASASATAFAWLRSAAGSKHPPGGHRTCPDDDVQFIEVRDKVPLPQVITFSVHYRGTPIILYAHYWYNADALNAGRRMPAIVEFNPYRRRDGMVYVDSMMYPWFAFNEYLCFRVDLQGSGDSEGLITDEYTEEELRYCVQVIEQIAALPICDGNVGMMGKSWSAINSLMVAARDDCPAALKAVIVCCGTDDRYNDDVHYMDGAMMQDNVGWPSSMWGWVPLPPDPAIVGARWEEMWRGRIQHMNFWFEQWGSHQTRDDYWSRTSVRDHYDQVKVPVFMLSGWQDGYKNPVERAITALGTLGKPVNGLLGPWGHKYPYDGFPGPRIDWLRYIVTHWWDRWLKGKEPDPRTTWPQLTVWLGESRAPDPDREPAYTDSGKWVAEDYQWADRRRDIPLYLAPGNSLSPSPPARHQAYVSTADVTLGTSALETSSWGECLNDDLPGDQHDDDRRSFHFDSEPLTEDLECFGYPQVTLNLECDRPLASIAVRLNEVSPETGQSHLVTYRFFNLCYRGGDMAHPEPVEAGLFAVSFDLNLLGHIFKRGWRVRLAVSPSFFPTMWQSPELATLTLHAGPTGHLPPSTLFLPGRAPRPEDVYIQALLPGSVTAYVDPEQYCPTERTLRDASSTRTVEHVSVSGRPGILVKKVFDSGSYEYGGVLENLIVDETASENFQIVDGDPLSVEGFTRYASTLARGDWRATAITNTRVWTEQAPSGEFVFRYEASVETFIGGEPFAQHRVTGSIPRRWV
jgi:predicted acyl esterase